MRIESSYPVLMTQHIEELRDFFVGHFGFEVAFSADWYASLKHPEPPHFELAFLAPDHASIPGGRSARVGGILLNFEVANAHAAWEELTAAGVPVVQPLRDEAFGQRHFILEAPGGVLVDVIENIPPAPEFAAQFDPTGG